MNEEKMRQLLAQDFSVGTDTFRDTLLERCLAVVRAGEGGIEIDDEELDLLAAAGNPFATLPEEDPEGR